MKKTIELKYGRGKVELRLPDKANAKILLPNTSQSAPDEEEELRRALDSPIGSSRLRDIAKPWDTAAIVVSDITRPVPTARILPSVIEELKMAGVQDENITVIFAVGSHRAHTPEERSMLVGEDIYRRFKCVDSSQYPMARIGVTSSGTPVDISEPVANADLHICIGNIEYHYFAGYSGGAKAVMPGVSSREAIARNHRFMTSPDTAAGKLDGNPVRMDIEEAGAMLGIDFIVNVVLDEKKRICKAVAGDPVLAHREGCRYLDKIYSSPIERQADIVVACAGGFPKDINLYQTQKALDNAKYAVRDGGTIILVGSCAEGYGEAVFEQWLKEAGSPQDLIDRVQTNFELGGHKAAAIAMTLTKAEVCLVSDMQAPDVRRAFLKPAASLQDAFEKAMQKYGEGADVIIMPYAGSTLPKL